MWPVTIVPPKYKEGFVLTLADKWCATKEIVTFMFNIIRNNPIIQYAYYLYIILRILRSVLWRKVFNINCLVVSGCSKVYYCNEGEILDKDKCKSLIEAKFKYYCAEGTGELKKTNV